MVNRGEKSNPFALDGATEGLARALGGYCAVSICEMREGWDGV
jgi:hypothetical protein